MGPLSGVRFQKCSNVQAPDCPFVRTTMYFGPNSAGITGNVIDSAKDEKPNQSFMEARPQILAGLVGGRISSRFVVPRPNFGGKRIPDSVIADVDSPGLNWVLVELETPVSAVTLKGDSILEEHARKGVSQVEEWREWILSNLALARRSRS